METNISALIEKLNLTQQIKFMGYLSDKELRYFYNLTEAFVYPSFYEGFGFPIIEAFCCGAPVVTSNVSSCPEIAKDSALIVDPESPEQIADAIENIITDQKLKEKLKLDGLKRSENFDFDKTARETLAVYQEVYCSS